MRTWTPIWLAFALSVTNAYANSFVGNGGSQGDVELLVSLKQLRETYTAIVNKSEDKPMLCTCNRVYSGRPICEPLAALNDAQVKFCNDSIYKVAPAVLKLLDARDTIHFRWTNDTIEVNDSGKSRDSDAVANRERREIVINQPRFLGMKPAERVFLLSHELMHFTDLDGKQLTDKGAVGPFAGEDGARDLINSMATAAGVMQGAYPKEIKGYKAKLYRSQAWKPIWFTLDFGGGSPQQNYDNRFQFNNYFRTQLSFRWQFSNHWGLMAAYRHEEQGGSVLDSIKTSEKIESFGVGPTYRFFLSGDPLSFWGQSFVMFHTLVEGVHGEYSFHEDVPGSPDPLTGGARANVLGANVGVSYYIPLFIGLWTYVGVNYEYHPYKYSIQVGNGVPDTILNYNNNFISGNVGVGYAF